MPRVPYMNFPFQIYRNTRFPPYCPPPQQNQANYSNQSNYVPKNNVNDYSNYTNNININRETEAPRDFGSKNKSNKNTNDYLFDLFGLKIFSDDVLLVSLIYFLYSEGVKDDGLFIVLILLLLS